MSSEVLALPCEYWDWIPGFEGLYQVSTRGRVRSVDRWVTCNDGRKRFLKGKILKPTRNDKGYLTVVLCRDGKHCTVYVHRMVLEVWGDGNPENKPQVFHRDENKENCSVENLSWASVKESINFGTGIERGHTRLSKPVQALDPETGVVVLEFPSTKEAGRKGFLQAAVSACCRGERRTHKGFTWRFKDI